MKLQDKFTKTDAGRHALEIRDGSLRIRERRVLIMIDGYRTLEDISKRIPPTIDLGKTIQHLLSSGFITALNGKMVHFEDGQDTESIVTNEHVIDATITTLTDLQRQVLEQELIEFLGPMATLVCAELWSINPNYDQALSRLAAEISQPAQQAQFRKNVIRRLA